MFAEHKIATAVGAVGVAVVLGHVVLGPDVVPPAVGLSGAGALFRHVRGAPGERKVPGGVLIGDPALYDALSHRFLLGSLFEGVASDVAAVARRAPACSRWVVGPAACRSGWPTGTGST